MAREGGKYGRSGQVMVEAVVALSLLVFVWITVSFASYMAEHRIRTLMAARHAAWMTGSGGDASTNTVESNFFYQVGMVKIQTGLGSGISGLIDPGSMEAEEFTDSDMGPFRARVTFGITDADINSTAVFPFTLMKVQLPLMPPSLLEDFLSVDSECQWDEVGDTWDSWSAVLDGVLHTFKTEAEGFIGAFANLL